MSKIKQGDMQKDRKIDLILDEYIAGSKQFYPELEFSSSSSIYSGEEPDSCNFEFGLSAKNLNGTGYEPMNNKKIIHYTSSIQNVIEILNNGILRLSNLSSLNDPQEMMFMNRNLGMYFSEKEMEDFRSSFFSASFCSVLNDENPDEFPMWRLYGNDGYGAAIIFTTENEGEDWQDYLIAKVQYGDCETVSKYKKYIEWNNSFQKKHNNPILNKPTAITALMALHKNDIWAYENEVRLLTHCAYDKYTLKEKKSSFSKLKHTISKAGNQYSFIELPIYGGEKFKEMDRKLTEFKYPNYLIKNLPALRITDIIIGYRVDNKILHNTEKMLNYHCGL